jgi:hypothetical protein
VSAGRCGLGVGLLFAATTLPSGARADEAVPESARAKTAEKKAADPWAGPDDPFHPDHGEEDPPIPAFESPHFRLGIHYEAAALLGSASGVFEGLDILAGARLTESWSIGARVLAGIGGWAAPGSRLMTSIGAGLSAEYLCPDVAGPGTGLALALTLGSWLPDACNTAACRTYPLLALAHIGYLSHASQIWTSELWALSTGVSGGVGYDPSFGDVAGRVGLYVGVETSAR